MITFGEKSSPLPGLEKLESRNGEEDLITPQIYQIVPLDLILDVCRSATPRKEHRPILHIFDNTTKLKEQQLKVHKPKVRNFKIQLSLTLLIVYCMPFFLAHNPESIFIATKSTVF